MMRKCNGNKEAMIRLLGKNRLFTFITEFDILFYEPSALILIMIMLIIFVLQSKPTIQLENIHKKINEMIIVSVTMNAC